MTNFSEFHAVVVDDDISSLEVIEALFQQVGVSYTVLNTPAMVMDTLGSLPHVDVIFLDLEMPNLNGYELLTAIHRAFGTQIPVVAYTAHTTEIVQARNAGFHSFLGKPLSSSKFSAQLADILDGHPVWSRTN